MTVEKILNGESKEVEYKEMVPANSKKYTKTAVAYANCAGGLLIFGVENNTWKVTGIPQEKVFEVADDFIVKELEFQGSNRSYDQIVAVGESVTEEEIEVLCDKMYQYALSKCRNVQEEESVKKVTKKNLLAWGLLQMQEDRVIPTNGYMLLTNNTMPEASIQCGVFKGTNRAVFVDRKEYAGPIYEQIDEAYQFVLRNIRMGAEFGGLLRRDVYELPIDSIRELIANAVIHRSYLEPSRVQVALYDDRLEITSPGMLIGGFTIEDLKAGCCQARNRGIVNALTYMKIIEQWGSGIPRLLENCKSAGLREPELLEIGGSFRVNMFRNTELVINGSGEVREKDGINENIRDKFVISSDIRDKFGENAAKIAGLMCEKPESTLDEIAEAIGVTRRTVEKQVKKLKEAGIVVRVGSNKSGVWKVIESGKC